MAHIMKLDKKPEVICGRKNVFIICQSELFRIWVAYLISRKNAPVPITIFIARMTLSWLQSLRCDPGWKEGGGRDAVMQCYWFVWWGFDDLPINESLVIAMDPHPIRLTTVTTPISITLGACFASPTRRREEEEGGGKVREFVRFRLRSVPVKEKHSEAGRITGLDLAEPN